MVTKLDNTFFFKDETSYNIAFINLSELEINFSIYSWYSWKFSFAIELEKNKLNIGLFSPYLCIWLNLFVFQLLKSKKLS